VTPLIIAIFTASLLGSLHCAGMCGAFVAFAVGIDDRTDMRRKAKLQLAYNIGRLITYTGLGAIAGSIGSAFNAAGDLAGVSRLAVVFAGASMVVFGSFAVLRLNGVRLPPPPVPGFMRRAATGAMRFAVDRPPLLRALLTGLSTTLLPCGWLYAFVITSAGTGSAALGALTMATFWLGTLPALVALGTGVQALAARLPGLGRRIPVITASLVIIVGMLSVFDRARLESTLAAVRPAPEATPEALLARVQHINDRPPPCCSHDDAHR
jgi:sulfite exporter TauE/SafE